MTNKLIIRHFYSFSTLCLTMAAVSACGTPPNSVEAPHQLLVAGEAATAAGPGAGIRSGNLLLGIGIDLF